MAETRTSRRQKKRPSKSKRIVKVILALLLVLVLGGSAYAYYFYDSLKSTANRMHLTLNGADQAQAKVNATKPINILLLGVDQRPNDPGRSDTMIVATLNPKNDSMLMTSIPRDTRTEIAGRGTMDKINAAYAYGGSKMAVKTAEKFADIKIDDVAVVNFQALEDLVDAVGGIKVNSTISWIDEGYYKKGYHYKKGEISLNGKQALGYVRMRHLDPRGDFGRNERQRKVIQAIMDKGASLTSVTHMKEILDALGSNIKTSFTFDGMKSMVQGYRNTRDHVYTYEVSGQNERINGIFYLNVPQSERDKVHQMIQDEKDGTLDMSKYDNSSKSTSQSSTSQ